MLLLCSKRNIVNAILKISWDVRSFELKNIGLYASSSIILVTKCKKISDSPCICSFTSYKVIEFLKYFRNQLWNGKNKMRLIL